MNEHTFRPDDAGEGAEESVGPGASGPEAIHPEPSAEGPARVSSGTAPPTAGPPTVPPATGPAGRPPGPPPARPSSGGLIALVIVVCVLLFLGLLALGAAHLVLSGLGEGPGGKCVALIEIEGLITYSGAQSFTGSSTGMNVILEQLREAEKDDDVKAIVVWLDTPGGAPAAAHAVYQRLKEIRKKKPVVAVMGDVAASGGYYIACGASKIVASPSTETGSIGVIFSVINFAGLADKLGVHQLAITSGPYKDTGSSFRPLRPDERALLQSLINDIYQQFVTDVASGRHIPVAKVRKLADGRVYTGRQAKKVGLVDELGTREDGIKLAAKLGGIEGWPKIKKYAAMPAWLKRLLPTGSLAGPWYQTVLERPGPWLTLPLPGAGVYLFPPVRP